MIAYQKTLGEFYQDIINGKIAEEIILGIGQDVSDSEIKSFKKSLPEVAKALKNNNFPENLDVALEYHIPLTVDRRIDFLISGSDENNNDHVVICELKQWDKVEHTEMPDIVKVFGEYGKEEKIHPSWQAFSYGSTISNFSQYVEDNEVCVQTCTFLHNYKRENIDELKNPIYREGIEKAPPFIEDEYKKFSDYVSKFIKTKSKKNILWEIDNGKIRPSKALADHLQRIINGNDDFILIDEQRIVFSNLKNGIIKTFKNDNSKKKVFIVNGGCGTGKSIIAIKLLGDLIQTNAAKNGERLSAFYVAKSQYVREAYFNKLGRKQKGSLSFKDFFLSSSKFVDSKENSYDVLIVDEAHRLTKESKAFINGRTTYRGTSQIKEIIKASRTSVFFIDEKQTVHMEDDGTVENIIKIAKEENAEVIYDERFELAAQFRCNGGQEYINWLETVFYNKEFKKSNNKVNYKIKIIDDIIEWKNAILEKNSPEMPSRMLSGDVFEWKSRGTNDPSIIDIKIGAFEAQWNRKNNFATAEDSLEQVGCMHTSQGMDFEYVGVIIADDLIYRNGKILTDYTKHPNGAREFKRPHHNKIMDEDLNKIDLIIRNTYKVLLSRGRSGCYLYVMDQELKKYLKTKIDELVE